ncbi:ABC transporter permease [Polycladidibacter stylochi]|uniref:ABC transporter permease n=1 Tax=Polycladidibacter stylochi TaxID=1807766 RepID=UPI00082D1108|nr:FtsX-like permease family protein [Pseudovibrio stylochi]
MSYASLIFKNLSRKMLRSVLLVLCIMNAFLIYGVLSSFQKSFEGAEAIAERLVVTNKIGSNEVLPLSYWNKIRQIEGVQEATHMTRLRAYYKNEYNILGANAVDIPSYYRIFLNTYSITENLVRMMGQKRDGALVGRTLAMKEGWQVGQKITLTSFRHFNQDGTHDWSFEVAGIFDGLKPNVDTAFLVVNYDYFNEALVHGQDTVSLLGVLPNDTESIDVVAKRIDEGFANSSHETRSQSEIAFMKAFMNQFANVELLVGVIVSASFITILMIVANTMTFAIRERISEIGILKVLGFSGTIIMLSIFAETLIIFAMGTLAAVGLTALLMPVLNELLSSVVPGISLSLQTVLQLLGFALLLSFLTGFLPAYRAFRQPIANALKHS